MSQGAQVDYDALAKQYGATASQVDYDALAKHYGAISSQAPSNMATISAGPKPYSIPWFKQKVYDALYSSSNGLPAVGATGGAIVGGTVSTAAGPEATPVGAIGGAGLGGMAGEAAKQLVRRVAGFTPENGWDVPRTSLEAATAIAKEGLLQGGIQALSETLPFLAAPLKKAAVGQYERALAPTTKINKAIVKKIGPEMVDRGIMGSLKNIETQAATQADALRPQLDAAYNAIPSSATANSGTKVIADLDALKAKYTVAGKVANPQAVKAIEGVQDIVGQYGSDIDPSSLRQLKQIFDEPVAAKGGYAGADLATQYTVKANKAAANSIRNVLSSASPDVAALNKEMSFWLDVKRVAQQSGLRRTGQEGGLNKVLAPLAGATAGAAGFATGGAGTGIEAAIGTAGAAALAQVMRSPAWRTVSAVTKDRLANALASGSAGDVYSILSRLAFAGHAAVVDRQTQPPNQ